MNGLRKHGLAKAALMIVLAAAVTAGQGFLLAEEAALPSAEELLDASIKATGGMKAYENVKNRYAKILMEMPAQGMSLTMIAYNEKPQKFYLMFEHEAIGKNESGTDGETAWNKSLMTGPQILTGEPKEELLRQATMDRYVFWRDHFSSVETTGIEDVDGKPAYAVLMTPKSGNPVTQYIDKESKLVVKTKTVTVNQMGEIPVEIFFSDYRDVDGILTPHKITQKAMGFEQIMTILEMKNNTEIPAGTFDLPADIQALLDKQNAPAAEAEAPAAGEQPE